MTNHLLAIHVDTANRFEDENIWSFTFCLLPEGNGNLFPCTHPRYFRSFQKQQLKRIRRISDSDSDEGEREREDSGDVSTPSPV